MLYTEDDPHYQEYEDLLSEGWIPHRKVDNSDAQYATFRDNIPHLLLLVSVYLLLSHLHRILTSNSGVPIKQPQQPLHRIHFFFISSLVVVTVLNGANILKIMTIITISYAIGKLTQGSIYNPVLTWIFNLGILFANEYCKGYYFSSLLGESFAWLVILFLRKPGSSRDSNRVPRFARMNMKVFNSDGTSCSILSCCVWYPSIWIITGNANGRGVHMRFVVICSSIAKLFT